MHTISILSSHLEQCITHLSLDPLGVKFQGGFNVVIDAGCPNGHMFYTATIIV